MGRITIITMLFSAYFTLAFLLHRDGVVRVPKVQAIVKMVEKRLPATSTQVSHHAKTKMYPQWSESEVQRN